VRERLQHEASKPKQQQQQRQRDRVDQLPRGEGRKSSAWSHAGDFSGSDLEGMLHSLERERATDSKRHSTFLPDRESSPAMEVRIEAEERARASRKDRVRQRVRQTCAASNPTLTRPLTFYVGRVRVNGPL
jgi:hypothetical protein